MKQRLQYFDMLKGLAIFAVVMGHVITMCIRDIDADVLFKIIKHTHMPLFFFISGYFSYKCSRDGATFASPRLWMRFKQLIVPAVVVSALWVCYYPHSGLQSPFVPTFHNMCFDIWKFGYWFTVCLFAIILIYAAVAPVLRRVNRAWGELAVLGAVELMMVGVYALLPERVNDLLGWPLVATYFPLFAAGVMCRRYPRAFTLATTSQWSVTMAFVVGAAVLYYAMYPWEFSFSNPYFEACVPVVWHLCLVVIAVAAVRPWSERAFADPDRPSIAGRVWSYLGRESLAIYLLHYFFLFPMPWMRGPMLQVSLGFVPSFVVAFVVAATVVAVTLGVNYIIQQSKPLALLLTGKL